MKAGYGPMSSDEAVTKATGKDEKRSSLRFHHEKLSSARQRSQMKKHWKTVIEAIEKALT